MRGNYTSDRRGILNPNYKHGLRNSRLFSIWSNILTRCLNQKSKAYLRYGARGITVCEEWRNDFKVFYDWAMSHGYQSGLTIDRINNNKGYSPDNCRWATMKTQANNTRRCRFIEIHGETKSLMEWCEITGVNYSTARDRIRQGWNPEKAVMTPPDVRFRKKVVEC